MLRLLELRAQGFRGINDPVHLAFEDGLSLIYGPNGYGKSSLAEAIEWVIFGSTTREINSRSKSELKNSVRNLHCPEDVTTFAELSLTSDENDSEDIVIRREFQSANSSLLTINGQPVDDLTSLGLNDSLSPNPVLPQHSFAEFVNTEPVNRWKALSQILGLQVLNGFRSSLQTAITHFRNQQQQYLELRNRFTLLSNKHGWHDLSSLIESDDASRIEHAAYVAVSILTKAEGNLPGLLAMKEALLSQLQEIPKQFTQVAAGGQPYTYLQLSQSLDDAKLCFDQVTRLWPEYLGNAKADIAVQQLEFIRAGLKLQPSPPTCPFCGQPSFTAERLTILHSVSERHDQLLGLKGSIDTQVNSLEHLTQDFFARLLSHLSADDEGLAGLSSSQRLSETLAQESVTVMTLVRSLKKNVVEEQEQFSNAVRALRGLFARPSDDFAPLKTIAQCLEKLPRLADELQSAAAATSHLVDSLAPFQSLLAQNDATVQAIGDHVDLLRNLNSLKHSLYAHAVLADAERLLADIEDFEKVETEQRLKQQEANILGWYQVVNPSEAIRFSAMKVAKVGNSRQVQLIGESYGKTLSALALLSESHLNALGLSVHLARATGLKTPLRFVVMDDPVQSLDESHSLRIARDLLGRLLSEGWQVVVLSHLDQFVKMCQDQNSLSSIELSSYSTTGPLLTECP
ncbi:MAG: AAA family ATPase [Symbiobacteriia bacterium]